MDLINKILFCFPSTSNKTFTYYYRFLCGVLYIEIDKHTRNVVISVCPRALHSLPTFLGFVIYKS